MRKDMRRKSQPGLLPLIRNVRARTRKRRRRKSVRCTAIGKWARKLAQCFRMGEPLVRLAPKKPVLFPGKELSTEEMRMLRKYEIEREARGARFKVLKTVCPRTAELTEEAECSVDPETRRRLEAESLEAFFAENAPGWPAWIFKAWQHLNPIGLEWMKWLYVWSSKQRRRPKEVNEVDYELAFNWMWKGYYSLTAEELAQEVFKQTKQLLSPEAIKKRRERLGLTTQRPPGPPSKEPESIV